MTSLDSSSTSGSWEVISDWQIRTDIHPLSVGPPVRPGMSEQVAPTAQLYEFYNYLAPADVSRHTMPTLPKQPPPTLGNNIQGWITADRTQSTEAAGNQPSPAQGYYSTTAGPALRSGSHFSQVITTAAATAKCPPPLLPNDNATTFTMGTKNHGDQKPWGPKPPPGHHNHHIQQRHRRQHGNSQPESHGNRQPESHGHHCRMQTITVITRAQLEARVDMLNCN